MTYKEQMLLDALKDLLDAFDIGDECDCGGSETCAVCNAISIISEIEDD